MPNNTLEKWEEKTVKDVTEICLGLTHTPKYVDEGVPFLSVKDISSGYIDFSNTKFITREEFESLPNGAKPKKGDVLFARVGTLGCPSIVDTDTEFGTFVSLGYFRPDNKLVLNTYLRYWMFSPLFWKQVEQNVQGSTLKNLNTGWLKDFKIPIPSIDEQQRIVGILDEAFENIEKAKQNTLQNLNNAKELFEIESNNIFEQLLNKYEPIKMSEIVNLITKGASPKWQGFEYCEKGKDSILFITSENVGKEELILENKKYLNKSFNAKQQRSILEKGDILTNIVGASIGRTTIFDIDELCNINQAVCLIRLKDKKQNKYVTKYMNSNCAIKSMTGMIKDCARANVSLTNIADLYVPLPIPEEQQKIVQQLDELQEQTKKLEQIYEQKHKDLDELKQSILQKAFNGEL